MRQKPFVVGVMLGGLVFGGLSAFAATRAIHHLHPGQTMEITCAAPILGPVPPQPTIVQSVSSHRVHEITTRSPPCNIFEHYCKAGTEEFCALRTQQVPDCQTAERLR